MTNPISYVTQLNINGSNGLYALWVEGAGFSGTAGFSGGITIGAYTLPATDGTAGQVLCTNGSGTVSWGTGGGGGCSYWVTGIGYISPCNNCNIYTTGDICVAGTANICLTGFGSVKASSICNSSGIYLYNSAGKVAEFGTTYTCLATIRTKDIYAYANNSCCVGLSSCRFAEGYINCMYACRIMKLPVGTNCY
jgi:hypothetical protein